MRFCRKKENNDSKIVSENLSYKKQSDRVNHIKRLKDLQSLFCSDKEFVEFIREDKKYLSFISAIEAEFYIPRDTLLQ